MKHGSLAVLAVLAVIGAPLGCSTTADSPDLGGTPSGRTAKKGCAGKCDGFGDAFVSPWRADINAINGLFPQSPISSIEEAYMVNVTLGEFKFAAPTHLFGAPVNVIPYSNEDIAKDSSGRVQGRGDKVIAQAFPRGMVGFAIKHHRPEYRTLDFAQMGESEKEHIKLQDTHIQAVIGVERDGKPGAITLNNPQSYENGLFGTPQYSMIFVKPVWPTYLDGSQVKAFNDNVRTMIAGFNAVTDFPGDYNGGDPLAAHNEDRLAEHVAKMVRAIAGDAAAQAWFKEPANQVYCAELIFLGTSAGLHFPLNAANIVPLVGQAVWAEFSEELRKHQVGDTSAFDEMNSNPWIHTVDLTLAPDELAPVWSYSPDPDTERTKMAFKPMTMADIVRHFLRTHIPREQLGEQVAPMQAAVLEQMKPGLLEAMGMDQVPEADPRRQAVDQLFGAMVATVGKPYGSYQEFQAALAPLMEQARFMTGPRDDSGTGYFVPPSLLHVVAQGKHPGGLLGLEYVGHGVHFSLTQLPPPAPSNPDDHGELSAVNGDNPFAASCQPACGGSSPDGSCWCDDQCVTNGDCCNDVATSCQ